MTDLLPITPNDGDTVQLRNGQTLVWPDENPLVTYWEGKASSSMTRRALPERDVVMILTEGE